MLNFSRLFSRRALLGVAFAGCLAGSSETIRAQGGGGPSESVSFGEIPNTFFQVQDANGYFWEPAENGAVTSGETRYLQSGLNLLVEGEVFTPASGEMSPPRPEGDSRVELELVEKRETYRIRRRLWFDRERGGVRVLDSIENLSGGALDLPVALRTTFPFAWQSLHGDDGTPLSADPALSFGERNTALLVHFSASEGRHDTFFVCRSGDGASIPQLTASSNRRELTLGYDLAIPAGATVSVLHWIGQAGLRETGDFDELFARFLRDGRLVEPGVERGRIATVANFSPESFPEPRAVPAQLRSLLALNRTLERVGAQRRGTDQLWLDSASQLAGTIAGPPEIEIEDNYLGPVSIPVERVAAIRGRAGLGRSERFYLRDGRVLVGDSKDFSLSFRPEGSELEQALDPDDFSLLLFSVSEKDGVAPPGSSGFLQTLDGHVLAIPSGASLAFQARSAWGSESIDFERVVELGHTTKPHPAFRIVLDDGARLTTFLEGGALQVPVVDGGEPVEIPLAHLSRCWEAGLQREVVAPPEETWIAFGEIPARARIDSGFLLSGSTLRPGTISANRLSWRQAGRSVEIPVDRIESIRRQFPGRSGGEPYILTLRGGESLEGRPGKAMLSVSFGDNERLIPFESVYAYEAPQS